MPLYRDIQEKKEKIAVVGLGYVGLPLAVAFARHAEVIGFDLNEKKIELYKNGTDPTCEVGNDAVKQSGIDFTCDEARLAEAKFYIIAVPTPINQDHTPNLFPVENASGIVGKYLTKGAVVVFESTVYPGVTEDICVPILEKESGLTCGVDFKVGYSPERINPGDKIHRLENITKIVSGIDEEALEEISAVYNMVITAGTFAVSDIRTAEAVKVAENSQRDINIAFMNELAIVFDKMGVDTCEVIAGMNTKWNSLGFYPGLVGGHCIGVDPYYFTYQAEKLGYHSQIILSGRKVNDSMGDFVADAAVKQMILSGLAPKNAKVIILGMTFKENCPDIRNSKVFDIVKRLREYEISPLIFDPIADSGEVFEKYEIQTIDLSEAADADCVILAVAHDEFKNLALHDFDAIFKKSNHKVFIDVKGVIDKEKAQSVGWRYWRL
uniref:UDP-N-acetyl-D-galactosamine dehydrogenase n=1 Tax=uncultured Bacillota bacterium TaxID=344338 RepID=A0A650EPA0_9FIRM|nr:UDP-N-acetyl-D-galactosamine dehydrogenase [uncultured Firmicutes bacterium]